jgi:hypothetical protein
LNRRRSVIEAREITVWLGIIAVASALQVLLLTGAAVAGAMAYRRATDSADRLRREALDPVVRRLNAVLDDLHEVAGRVQSADDQVRDVVSRTTDRVGQAASIVGARLWPVLGIARGLRAALGAVRKPAT